MEDEAHDHICVHNMKGFEWSSQEMGSVASMKVLELQT